MADNYPTYPAVRRPDSDRCIICSDRGLAWFPTEEGDRPLCGVHLYEREPDAYVTYEEWTSECGNSFPEWTEDDHEYVNRLED